MNPSPHNLGQPIISDSMFIACFKSILIVPSHLRQTIPDKMAESWDLPPLLIPPNLTAKRYLRHHPNIYISCLAAATIRMFITAQLAGVAQTSILLAWCLSFSPQGTVANGSRKAKEP